MAQKTKQIIVQIYAIFKFLFFRHKNEYKNMLFYVELMISFQSDVSTLCENRDESRCKLYTELGKFIEVVSQLPLEARSSQIEVK